MANKKISELVELTDPESTDVLPIVDGTDNTTKKITIANLVNSDVGGSNTQVQFNNNGVLSGDPNFTWDGNQVAISGGLNIVALDNQQIFIQTNSNFQFTGSNASASQFQFGGLSIQLTGDPTAGDSLGCFALITGNNGSNERFQVELLTTNNTPTNFVIPFTGILNAYFIEAKIVAQRTGGSSGTDGDSAAYIRRALYKSTSMSATPTLVGSIQDGFTAEDQAGWDATFTVTGNNVAVQITGAANNNITWVMEVQRILIDN